MGAACTVCIKLCVNVCRWCTANSPHRRATSQVRPLLKIGCCRAAPTASWVCTTTHTNTHARTNAHKTYTCTHAHTRARTDTPHIITHTHIRIHTHTHTHTHMITLLQSAASTAASIFFLTFLILLLLSSMAARLIFVCMLMRVDRRELYIQGNNFLHNGGSHGIGYGSIFGSV